MAISLNARQLAPIWIGIVFVLFLMGHGGYAVLVLIGGGVFIARELEALRNKENIRNENTSGDKTDDQSL
jgi:hypothetical protein